MNHKIYNVAIIGAGSIGAMKPIKYDYPGGGNILTMAHAVVVHPRMRLYGIVDSDIDKASAAAQKWEIENAMMNWTPWVFRTIEELLAWYDEWNISMDIITVCTPTNTHHEIIEKCVYCKPRLIIAEKPFCENVEEAEHVMHQAKSENVPIAIDYIRRYPKAYQELKENFDDGEYGEIYHTKVTYTRGLKHEASHAVDLMRYFFGEFIDGSFEDNGIVDREDGDSTKAGHMEFEKCSAVFFCPVDGRAYSIFEIEIFTEKGRIKLEGHGEWFKIYKPKPESVYGDYLTMVTEETAIHKTFLSRGLLELMQNCVDHLEKGTPLLCTAEDALAVQKIYRKLGI